MKYLCYLSLECLENSSKLNKPGKGIGINGEGDLENLIAGVGWTKSYFKVDYKKAEVF